MKDSKKFVVIAQARSGSTLLQKALHAREDIVCHGEVLSRQWINGLVPKHDTSETGCSKRVVTRLLKLRDSNIEEFLDEHIYNFPSHTVGFKIIYEDLFLPDWSTQVLEYFKRNDVSVFHLVRLNALAALVSRKRMAKFGLTHSNSPGISDENQHRRVEIRSGEIQRFIALHTLYGNRVNLHFPRSVPLYYEHISLGYENMLQSLGLEITQMQNLLTKLNTRTLEDTITNYADVRAYDLCEDEV